MAGLLSALEKIESESQKPTGGLAGALSGLEKEEALILGQQDFGEERLGLLQRARLGFQSDTSEEAVQSLTNMGMEARRIPGSGRVVFRSDPALQFSPVNPEGFDFGDVGEFVGREGPSTLGEIAGTLLTKNPTFGKLLASNVLGGQVGETVRQGAKLYSDIPVTLETAKRRAIGTGVSSAVGVGVGKLLDKGVDMVRGGGMFSITPEGGKAMAAAKKIPGHPGMTPGQVSQSPFLNTLEKISGRVFPQLEELYRAQRESIVSYVNSLRNPQAKSNFLSSMIKAQDAREHKLMFNWRAGRRSFSNRDIQKGLAEWDVSQRGIVGLKPSSNCHHLKTTQ